MERPRLLFIHEKLGRMAGAEQHIAVTAPFLKETFDLYLAYQAKTGKDEAAFGSLFNNTFQMTFEGDERSVQQALNQILDEVKPNLVYLHKCLSAPMIEAVLARHIPIVRMVHDHEVYCMRTYKYFPWSRRICHKKAGPCCLFPCLASLQRDRKKGEYGVKYVSYNKQQRLIAADQQISASFVVTTYMRDELILQGYPKERIFIFPPTPRNLVGQPPEPTFSSENIIVFAGQIIRGKGLDCLIRALALVKTPFKLIALGDGSHKPYCESLINSLNLKDRIVFPGFVPHETMQEYYRQATLAAVPSVWPEPIATWGLEVMRYGLPVVGFDAGGISDWLKDGETGYLIPWMDIGKMAERIEYLLNHKDEARRLGQNAQRFIRSHYDFDEYIVRLGNKLLELATMAARPIPSK